MQVAAATAMHATAAFDKGKGRWRRKGEGRGGDARAPVREI